MGASYSNYGAAALIDLKSACIDRTKRNAKAEVDRLDKNSDNYNRFVAEIESDERTRLSKIESIFLMSNKYGNHLTKNMQGTPMINLDLLSPEKFNSLITRADADQETYGNDEMAPVSEGKEETSAPNGLMGLVSLAFKGLFGNGKEQQENLLAQQQQQRVIEQTQTMRLNGLA